MSGTNVNPPQTYSRLFRPWDTHRTQNEVKQSAVVKMEVRAIKPELNSGNNGHVSDTDREECALSSSSSHSSCDDSFFSSDVSHPTESPTTGFVPDLYCPALSTAEAIRAVSQHYSALEQQHRLHMTAANSIASTEDIYYAAAHSAAASGLPLGAGAAPGFAMDPFTLGLMEQEYARVMAEDAQLKAINARKQRPKKFKCPHCDVAFSNNGQLKGHIRIHTGERPFKCDEATCGKTFTRNEELTRHKRIHTGLRPYPCTACGKKFGRRDHLKKHMKTHMPQDRQLGPAIFLPMYPYLYGY